MLDFTVEPVVLLSPPDLDFPWIYVGGFVSEGHTLRRLQLRKLLGSRNLFTPHGFLRVSGLLDLFGESFNHPNVKDFCERKAFKLAPQRLLFLFSCIRQRDSLGSSGYLVQKDTLRVSCNHETVHSKLS